ncbi:MAG TPA: TolC family protein [Cyclobacteriaceae bacterium]|jgi:outer membrane protein TolC|nr:TolC family protein [Cyclobacteriaceae bacterium]
MKKKFLVGCVLSLGLLVPGFSQENYLPPMDSVIAAALAYSPLVKTQQASIYKQEAEMKRNSKLWLQSLQLQVGSQYNSYYTNENVALPVFGSQTGLILRFSVYDFISRKNVIDRSRWEVEEAKQRTDQQRVVIRQMVISYYQTAVKNQALLRVCNERVEAAKSHVIMAEHEFKTGDIQVSELSRVTQIAGQAQMELEKAKAEYYEAYFLLEAMIGKKLSEI